jgi:hypothetical protein
MNTEFTILPGCYDNAWHFRKCLGIYVIAQGFTIMPRHLRHQAPQHGPGPLRDVHVPNRAPYLKLRRSEKSAQLKKIAAL